MDRRSFITKSAGLLVLGSLVSLGCTSHAKKKTIKYSILADRCRGCRKCLGACENHAISLNDRLAVIDPLKCKGCGDCKPYCHHDAIVQIENM